MRAPIIAAKKHRPDCHASKPYAVANAGETLEVMATMNPIVTDMTKVAQRTGGKARSTTGRKAMLHADSSVKVPCQSFIPWR
jgi:hypothetical protein